MRKQEGAPDCSNVSALHRELQRRASSENHPARCADRRAVTTWLATARLRGSPRRAAFVCRRQASAARSLVVGAALARSVVAARRSNSRPAFQSSFRDCAEIARALAMAGLVRAALNFEAALATRPREFRSSFRADVAPRMLQAVQGQLQSAPGLRTGRKTRCCRGSRRHTVCTRAPCAESIPDPTDRPDLM